MKKFIVLIMVLFFCSFLYAETIVIPKGSGSNLDKGGTIDGELTVTDGLTIGGTTVLIETSGSDSFLHNYQGPGNGGGAVANGENVFLGVTSGNFLDNQAAIVTQSSYNTGVGFNSLNDVTTGFNNTGVGHNSTDSLTTGSSNSALGENTLTSLTTGIANSAIGAWALKSVTIADRNVAVGFYAGSSIVDADDNLYIGSYSGFSHDTGVNNCMFGNSAGRYQSGGTDPLAKVFNSVYLGYAAKGTEWADYEITIGATADGRGPNTTQLGTQGETTDTYITSQTLHLDNGTLNCQLILQVDGATCTGGTIAGDTGGDAQLCIQCN